MMQHRRWIVLLAAMWVSWFDFGLQSTLGTLFVPLLHEFGEDRSTTASVQSVFIAVNQGLGVFAGLLITRFGITKVTLIGSVLIPMGFFLSYFATSIVYIIICISFISAIGVSLMFVSSAVMLRLVFSQKEIAVAIALHSASISLAGLTYPFILDFILEAFELNGTFLILSGYLLNNIAVGIFFSYTINELEREKKSTIRKDKQRQRTSVQGNKVSLAIPVGNPWVLRTAILHTAVEHNKDAGNSEIISVSKKVDADQGGLGLCETSSQNSADRNYAMGPGPVPIPETDAKLYDNLEPVPISEKKIPKGPYSSIFKPRQPLTGIFSVPYVSMLIATGLIIASQNGYVSLLMDIFESKGYTKDQGLNSYLSLNLTGLIARLLPAFLKQIRAEKLLVLAILFSLCGCFGQLMILFSTNYTMKMAGVGLTGIPMGGVISVASIVVTKFVGHKKFPVAFGLILSVIGVLVLSCGPVYGAIRDHSDSYSQVLVINTSAQFTGSVLFMVALYTGKKQLDLAEKDNALYELVGSLHKAFYFSHMY